MSFEEPNNPRSSEIVNNQIQLTELATYEERTPGHHFTVYFFIYDLPDYIYSLLRLDILLTQVIAVFFILMYV